MSLDSVTAPESGVIDEVGDKIGDLRAHLAHAHPLRPSDLAPLQSADLAALHRRLHGRSVTPGPDLIDVHLVELSTVLEERTTTCVPLADAVRPDDPLVWLPLRIADLAHAADAVGHSDEGGCRACADIVDATIRATGELDATMARELAARRRQLGLLLSRISTVVQTLDDDGKRQTRRRTGEKSSSRSDPDPDATPADLSPPSAETWAAARSSIAELLDGLATTLDDV